MQYNIEQIAKIIDPRPWASPMSWPRDWDHPQDAEYAKQVALNKAQAIISMFQNYQDDRPLGEPRYLSC